MKYPPAFALLLCAMPLLAVDFDREVRPILSDTCFACHGPDDNQRKANLRFDTKEGAFERKGVIVPGDPEASRLIRRITATNPANKMPPEASGRKLNEKQIALLKEWIKEGATWKTHWAYEAPKRPALPEVKNTEWPRNAIDRFVAARLEKEGLKPSPEADRVTLLRRLSFDLTGLPPAPSEIDTFLADRSPEAYEKQVDRLLASPRYGERMAMQWLDIARYADTHGYHIDSHRDMWPWREWVIRAFNGNMRFDQFVIEQLAGDLLPDATRDQQLATGFNRNHMINFEGGAIPEEYQTEYVVDRVETTAVAFLGMTMGCARCHDHKYDPIKQRDFYRFFAFFNTIPEKGLDGRTGNAEPALPLPDDREAREAGGVKAGIGVRKAALEDPDIEDQFETWQQTRAAQLPPAPRNGLTAHYEMDGNFADTSGGYRHGRTLTGGAGFSSGMVGRRADFDGETHVEFTGAGAIDRDHPFSIAFWFRPNGKDEQSVLQRIDDAQTRRGYEFWVESSEPVPGVLKRDTALYFRLANRWPENSIEVKIKPRFVLGEFHHIAFAYDGSGRASGLTLFIDGRSGAFDVVKDNLTSSFASAHALEIGSKNLGKPFKGSLDDLRFYDRSISGNEAGVLAIHWPIRSLLETAGKRSKDDAERLRDYYFTWDAAEANKETYAEFRALERRQQDLERLIPSSMIMSEMAKTRDTFILARGDYRNKGEKVTPDVPSVLPPLPKDAARDRLTLAKWLTSPEHPLTARVAVNRYWQMYFGIGLVKTSEDFGSQGEPPSNPELLDWLAREFIEGGWDVKSMQRLIVTSAAYRQSSKVTPELRERDPENRLLARGPRFRLPAEMVRDNALAASGLLVEKIGGKSVLPYQPAGLWDDIAYGDVYSAQKYEQGHGEDLYRRSMYTFWKRTAPPPSLNTFDAPDREKCTARRALTNTPLQALVLLNDPTYVEAARVLAARAIEKAGPKTDQRISFAYRLTTGRKPASKELSVLRDLARVQLLAYKKDPSAARKLAGVGDSPLDGKLSPVELAAWTTVASVILNLDETITKE